MELDLDVVSRQGSAQCPNMRRVLMDHVTFYNKVFNFVFLIVQIFKEFIILKLIYLNYNI